LIGGYKKYVKINFIKILYYNIKLKVLLNYLIYIFYNNKFQDYKVIVMIFNYFAEDLNQTFFKLAAVQPHTQLLVH